ncbi:MAG: EAL domain-containing protein, partial [Bacillota bacterium]|nr:EAL domain-containing protein [Bacillota bacterium]
TALTRLQSIKGWFYILVTAVVLFLIIVHNIRSLERSNQQLEQTNKKLENVNEELVALQEELQQQCTDLWAIREQFFNRFQAFTSGMLVQDPDGQVIYANEAACNIFGLTLTQLQGFDKWPQGWQSIYEDKSPFPWQEYPGYKVVRVKKPVNNVVMGIITKENAAPCWIIVNAQPIFNSVLGELEEIVSTFVDISQLKEAEASIFHHAHFDQLTNLPNRLLFSKRLEQALEKAQAKKERLALLFLDLDRFKLVNDTLGHAAGDRLLVNVAGNLTSNIGSKDTIARMGGDEFILLLPDIKKAGDVATVAESVLASFDHPWEVNGHEFYITASIGIALYPDDGKDAETLLKNADTAMYSAKEQGKNTYEFFTAGLNQQAIDRVALEKDMRKAIDQEEFILQYQPIFNLSDGKMAGLEALIRWRHKTTDQLISPAQFIPAAEDSGLILPLGEWIIKTACRQAVEWQNTAFPLCSLSVNLSARQFRQTKLLELVNQVLIETKLPPQRLILEITETTAMDDIEYAIYILKKIRQLGVRIAIDDFGTGYSSLSYLKKLPIDIVKIDHTFVRDIISDPADAAIATAIITMAHSLNIKVVAEGVETKEQLMLLKAKNCDKVQGYLLSKPLPPEEILLLTTAHHAICS